MDNYKFMINPLRSGTFMGTLSFVAPDGNYTWFSIEVWHGTLQPLWYVMQCCDANLSIHLLWRSDQLLWLTVSVPDGFCQAGMLSFTSF